VLFHKANPELKHLTFAKNKHLVSNRQFKRVLDANRRAGDGLLTLFVAANDCGYPRLGVSVGRICGNAVVRNRLKRVVREAFRQNQDRIPQGYDYVVMASRRLSARLRQQNGGKTLAQFTLERVQRSFLDLVRSALGTGADDAGEPQARNGQAGPAKQQTST